MSKNIILIDDNPAENLINEQIIHSVNSSVNISIIDCGIDAVKSLTQSLSDLENNEKHIVFLDQKMPDLSGIEVIEELEDLIDLDPNRIEIYFLTSDNSVRLQEKSKNFETLIKVLHKPLTPEIAAQILCN
jgi:CheY-like chemotaxis protein